MGSWLSRGKSKSTSDQLEKIKAEIASIESFKRDTQQTEKKVIGTLVVYFAAAYAIGAAYAYFFLAKRHDYSRLWLLTPFLVAPVLFLLVKKVLTWWFRRKIRRNEAQLAQLQRQRKKILDEVMETETYKVNLINLTCHKTSLK